MSETQPETPDQPEPQAPDDVDSKVATGVGVYNVTLQRFVGGKHANAKDAQAFIDGRKDDGHSYVTRKV